MADAGAGAVWHADKAHTINTTAETQDNRNRCFVLMAFTGSFSFGKRPPNDAPQPATVHSIQNSSLRRPGSAHLPQHRQLAVDTAQRRPNTPHLCRARGEANMEIKELAERILFGNTLADKLTMAEVMTDLAPGGAVAVPALPGRPHALRLDHDRERTAFPGLHELDKPGMRGRILHFFANHELLATELMALALLRFPDADPRFRMGLVRTIEEEQKHLRMYHQRMTADGVELGEIPVSSFFWDCLAPMKAPIDFVTGMSLTFEQANLDFARYYASAFRQCGDIETADVLDIVYREEIGHVKNGVVWFDRLRDDLETVSMFDAWVQRLPAPLTPVRARGVDFDEDGRRLAGFSEDYINRVRVVGASRGRPPGVWLFNCSCDHRWLHGDLHPQSRAATALERDLDALPMFMAATDDVVVVQKSPSTPWLLHLRNLGVQIPALCVQPPDGPILMESRHLWSLNPWGWSDDMARRMAPLAKRLVHPGAPLQQRALTAKAVNRKSFAAGLLAPLVDELNDPRISARDSVGSVHHSPDSAWQDLLQRWERRERTVVKADHGTSGRNMIRLRDDDDLPIVQAWLRNAFRHQPAVVIEPWLDRVADLSVLSRVDESGDVQHLGITRFLSDIRGQYRGAVVGKPTFGLSPELVRSFHDHGRDPGWVDRTLRKAAHTAGAALHNMGYTGPFGVDAFLHRVDGDIKLRPLVEVNSRYTMGNISLGLSQQLARGSNGYWWIVRVADVGDPAAFVETLRTLAPPRTVGSGAQTRIASGAVFTTDPESAEAYLSLLMVGDDAAATLQPLRDAAQGRKLLELMDGLT